MNHEEDAVTRGPSDDDESVVVAQLRKVEGVGITEDRARLVEADTVLASVDDRLFPIPFENAEVNGEQRSGVTRCAS